MWTPDPETGALLVLGVPVGPLGFVVREGAPGHSVWEYTIDPAHKNPNGALHGGVTMALLDSAMGHAIAEAVARKGRFNVAAQMSVSFLLPALSGVLRAKATAVKIGKRLAHVEGRVTNEAGGLVATATATHTLLP